MEKKDLSLIEKLRTISNASIVECKKALEENNWNLEAATKSLAGKGYEVSKTPGNKLSGVISIIGIVLFLIIAIAPGVIITMAPPELNTLSHLQWLMVILISSAVSILMITRSLKWIIGGLVTSVSSYVLSFAYFNLLFATRVTFVKIEFAIPVLIALGLGVLIVVGFEKLFARKTR